MYTFIVDAVKHQCESFVQTSKYLFLLFLIFVFTLNTNTIELKQLFAAELVLLHQHKLKQININKREKNIKYLIIILL